MLIVLTGAIGVGKSTVCHKIAEAVCRAGFGCGGVITTKGDAGTIIVRDVGSGEQTVLAGPVGEYAGLATEKYSFNPAALAFGERAIERGISQFMLLVDEFGPLEIGGGGFIGALELINTRSEGNQLLVIRSELVTSFLPVIQRAPVIFETTVGNRDQLPGRISKLVLTRRPHEDESHA